MPEIAELPVPLETARGGAGGGFFEAGRGGGRGGGGGGGGRVGGEYGEHGVVAAVSLRFGFGDQQGWIRLYTDQACGLRHPRYARRVHVAITITMGTTGAILM